MRILFVDDEPHLLSGLRRLTRPVRRWRTRFAVGGEQALAMLAEEPADVLITDMRMPGMDGIELLRAVRSAHPRATCLVLTGYASAESSESAGALADGWLTKPCSLETLDEAIGAAVARRASASDEGTPVRGH